jgi:hypothetical protein
MSAEYLGMNNICSPMNDTGTNTTTVQTKGKTNDYKHVIVYVVVYPTIIQSWSWWPPLQYKKF